MSKSSSPKRSQTVVDGERFANLSHTFKFLLATQFLSRGIPFVFNSRIVRHLTEEDYAIMQLYAVQFHLFITCVLFLSREGFRRACMRTDKQCDGSSRGENAAELLTVGWMAFQLGVVVTLVGCHFVLWWKELGYCSQYAQAIWILNLLLLKLWLIVEIVATLSCCLTTYILIVKLPGMPPVRGR